MTRKFSKSRTLRLATAGAAIALLTLSTFGTPSAGAAPNPSPSVSGGITVAPQPTGSPAPSGAITNPGPVLNGRNVGPWQCSSNDRVCNYRGGFLTNADDQRTNPPELRSNNGQYRAYIHGQTCRLTLEQISNSRVIWTSPNQYGCYNREQYGHENAFANLNLPDSGGMELNGYKALAQVRTIWSAGTEACRGASYGGDLVLMDYGQLAYWSDSDNPFVGRVQQWNNVVGRDCK